MELAIKKEKLNKIIAYIAIFIMTCITSLVLVSNPFSELLPRHDSSMFMYFGYAMKNGQTMYTEVFDHKGPIIFILNYIGALLSTSEFTGVYIIEFTSIFFFLLYTYKLGKLWLSSWLAYIPLIPEALILTFFLEGGNLTEEYALPFIAYSLYAFSKFYRNNQKIIWYEIILTGISFSVVFLLRANMVSLWAIFCVVMLIKFMQEKRYIDLIKCITLFVTGVLIILVPICFYLYANGALQAGFFQALIFNIMYLESSTEKSEAIRQLYAILSRHYIVLFFVLYFLGVIYQWKNFTKNEKLFSLSIVSFSILSFYTSVMSARVYKHYLMPMIPVMSIPIICIMYKLKEKISVTKIYIAFCIMLFLIYYNQLVDVYNTIYTTNIETINKSDGLDINEEKIESSLKNKKENINISKVIKENTKEDDKIYVHRNSGLLYLLSDRLSATKYFNLPAVDLNENVLIGTDFLKEVTTANTKLIVLDSKFNNEEKTGIELDFFDFILNNYQLIYVDNSYFIYLKN